MKKILFTFLVFLSLLTLYYLLLPGPKSIVDFETLPYSIKSSLSGDTVQVPNIVAYFSNTYRSSVISFFSADYNAKTVFPFPPFQLVHPPEHAFTAIKDQTQSTYLVELVYPLRDSLFVNGLEPFEEKTQENRYPGATPFLGDDGIEYDTKTTLRYYPSNFVARIIVWMGINISCLLIYQLARKEIWNLQ